MSLPHTATRRLSALAVLVLVVGVLAACGSDDSGDAPRTVTVVGSGTVTGVPDTLRASVGVEVQGEDVSSALNAANAAVAAVTEAVENAGVDRADIQTEQVSLNPQYTDPAPGTTRTAGGYQATNSLRLTIREVDAASEVLAAAANASQSATINNVSFAIDDDAELLGQARESAFNDARQRAEQYASLAEDSLGSVISIDEASEGDAPSPMRDMEAAAVPLEPGEQNITFTVTVTFALN